MLSRDWQCLNRSCGQIFHSYEKGNPECPQCGCVRVSWVPGGGHIGKAAPGIDRTLRTLAADYGMTNINSPSPSRLNRAMPVVNGPRGANLLGSKLFAPGFSADVYDTPTCGASTSAVNLRGVQPVGRAFGASRTVRTLRQATKIVRQHRP